MPQHGVSSSGGLLVSEPVYHSFFILGAVLLHCNHLPVAELFCSNHPLWQLKAACAWCGDFLTELEVLIHDRDLRGRLLLTVLKDHTSLYSYFPPAVKDGVKPLGPSPSICTGCHSLFLFGWMWEELVRGPLLVLSLCPCR